MVSSYHLLWLKSWKTSGWFWFQNSIKKNISGVCWSLTNLKVFISVRSFYIFYGNFVAWLYSALVCDLQFVILNVFSILFRTCVHLRKCKPLNESPNKSKGLHWVIIVAVRNCSSAWDCWAHNMLFPPFRRQSCRESWWRTARRICCVSEPPT